MLFVVDATYFFQSFLFYYFDVIIRDLSICENTWPRVFILNPAVHEIYLAHNCLNDIIVGILTFISTINTSERLKARNSFLFSYKQLKFRAQLIPKSEQQRQ